MTRFYTQNEGEFYDLGYEEALRRITTARDEFRSLTQATRLYRAGVVTGERSRASRS